MFLKNKCSFNMKRNKKMLLKVFEVVDGDKSPKTTMKETNESNNQMATMESLNNLQEKNSIYSSSDETQQQQLIHETVNKTSAMANYVQNKTPQCYPELENIATPVSITEYDISLLTPDAPIYSPITPIDKNSFMSACNIMIPDSSENSSPVRSMSLSPETVKLYEKLSKSDAFQCGDLSDDSVKDPDFIAGEDSDDSSFDEPCFSNRFTTTVDVHTEIPTCSKYNSSSKNRRLQIRDNNVLSPVPINDDNSDNIFVSETEIQKLIHDCHPQWQVNVSNPLKRRASENDLLQTQPFKRIRRSASLSNLILPHESNKPISPKKRKVSDPSKWKRNAERIKRVKGEAYKTLGGKDIAARPIKEPKCVKNPKHKCNENVSETIRKSIYESFRNLKSLMEQRQFIVQHVTRTHKKRSTTDGPSRKQSTNHYSLTIDKNTKAKVCREFFLDTLNITEGMVRGALNKISTEGVLQNDKRGAHSPANKLSIDRINQIKNHIFSFPTMESHFCRSSTEYKYLDAALNIQIMHTLYKIQCSEKGTIPACIETYRKIFRSYKLKYHVPKKDLCKKCVSYRNGECEEGDYLQHLKRRDDAFLRRDADKQAAVNDEKTLAFNFDLEAVLQTPKGAAGPFFYFRKLAVYNLTFYKFGDQDVDCYTWDETEGKRGSVEVATCVYKYISDKEGITHVRMMSDNCGGQQKNYHFCCMLLHLVSTHETIEIVDHVFFESGHSHMECDSVHSKIEQKAKNVPVYTPDGWTQIMRSARTNPRPFNVNVLVHDEFLDFNSNEVQFAKDTNSKKQRKKKRTKNNDTIENGSQDETGRKAMTNFHDAVWMQYRKESPKSIFIKGDYDDKHFTELKLKAKRGKSATLLPIPAYDKGMPISKAKKGDLMKLCRDNQIPKYYHSYFANLPVSEEVIDRLPEPDQEEED